MGAMIRKNIDSPEETRPFNDGKGRLRRRVGPDVIRNLHCFGNGKLRRGVCVH